jgi:hypothetical protein
VFNYYKIIFVDVDILMTAESRTGAILLEDRHNSQLYRNFMLSLKTPKTKKLYAHFLDKYYLSRPENSSLPLEEIIKKIQGPSSLK